MSSQSDPIYCRSRSFAIHSYVHYNRKDTDMKNLISAICLFVLLVPVISLAFDITGSYSTSEGNMTLRQNGDRVSGRYTQDNGEITGVLNDMILDGFWIEDHSDRRCSNSKNGRYYWGRISYEFTENGFSGTWGYCNEEPSRKWTGKRSNIPASQSNASKFVVEKEAESIEGAWSSSEGDITFRQDGSKVTGRYTQDNGEIMGTMRGTSLDSYWIEDHSDRRCSSPKNGRYFWGKLQINFDGDRFSGKWGYCDDKPSRQWTGKRK